MYGLCGLQCIYLFDSFEIYTEKKKKKILFFYKLHIVVISG